MTTILVSGASVAGAATAYWLGRQGYSVTVVERHDGPPAEFYRVVVHSITLEDY